MFTHIVLFKVKEPTKENLEFIENTLLAMNGNVKELKELGEMLEPPVGKSGINHRLRKIEKIAEELRSSKF